MNYYSYLDKSQGKGARTDLFTYEEADRWKEVRVSNTVRKIKKILTFDSVKANFTDSEILHYTAYETKLNEIMYKTVIFGVMFAISRRILFAKLGINNLTTSENIFADLVGPVTYLHYVRYFDYPGLYKILYEGSKIHDDDEEIKKKEKDLYNIEKAKHEQHFRSKFYTNSQYWH